MTIWEDQLVFDVFVYYLCKILKVSTLTLLDCYNTKMVNIFLSKRVKAHYEQIIFVPEM
jgi:hypothetical protein